MNRNSLDIKNNMLLQHSQNFFCIYKFSSKKVSIWCQKNICAALILETLWKKTSVYFCISSFQRKSLFQRCSMILYGWGWIRGRLNNFLKTAHCVRLVKCLIVFHFNWNFRLFFSISILPSIALKRWKFPENLDFKGRIVAKFLIRNHFLLIHNNMAIK